MVAIIKQEQKKIRELKQNRNKLLIKLEMQRKEIELDLSIIKEVKLLIVDLKNDLN